MFWTRWYHRAKVYSDEGFSIEYGQDWLVYQRASRRMTITIDYGATEVTIFRDTVNRWDDDPSGQIDSETKFQIVSDIQRALESRGLSLNQMD
jgi:hypothetical protein